MKRNVFLKAGILLLSSLFFTTLMGCNTLKPITPDEIPAPAIAREVNHAEAWSIIFFPWGIENWRFTEGPFEGYTIHTDGEFLTGYRIYVHGNGGSFRPQDIEAYYERKLVEEWWPREEGWERVQNLNETRNLWAWRRGRQIFIVVCGSREFVKNFQTYLIER